ncbi:MAG TPA: hypothetical protein VLR10_05175, partial [Nitrososphaeraceae archaeon]|nr:hypothetical protein [Nitrososphaeraceae archaeon]
NIDFAIDGNNSTITNGSNTKSNTLTFEFSGNDTGVGIDYLECSLDGASFIACTSPVQLTSDNLLDGTHSFMVIAQDKVGNIMTTPVLFSWTVDTLPPTTTINTAIDGNNGTLVSGDGTMSTSMAFTFSGNDTEVGSSSFECSIDNSNFTACVSPIKYDNLTEGVHRLAILSEDKVGNKGSVPSSFNWTIDTEAPSTSIFSATDGNNNFMSPGSNTSSNSMTFEFSANDTGGSENNGVGIAQIECSIDNSNFTACVSPVEISSDILTDGAHIFKIRAQDNVGNMNPKPASFNWTIDTVPPTTIITNVVDSNKSSITNGSNTKSNTLTFEFSGNDTGVGIDYLECSLDGASFSACTSPVQFTSENITDGTHTFEVLSVDNSTNQDPSPASFSWNVDTIPPETSILSAIDGNESVVTTSQNTSSNLITFDFSGNDTGGVGINHLECSLDGASFTVCSPPVQFSSENITDGTHTFEVLSVDNSTNKDPSPASFNWNVDTISPIASINTATDGNNRTI